MTLRLARAGVWTRAASLLIGAVIPLGAAMLAGPAQAVDLKRHAAPCQEHGTCAWYEAAITPPDGFHVHPEFGRAAKLVVFVPDELMPDMAAMLIHVRTVENPDGRTLEQFTEQSEALWRRRVPDTMIERLNDVPRAGDARPWQVMRFTNPSLPRQAHEIVAFGEQVEKSGERFLLMVTITSASEESVASGLPAWRDILDRM